MSITPSDAPRAQDNLSKLLTALSELEIYILASEIEFSLRGQKKDDLMINTFID